MSKKHTTDSLRSKLHTLKSVRLSEQEHSAMKSQLLSYADMHVAPDRRPSVVSPFSYKSLQYSSRFVFSGALALLLLVGSTGVSFAAENTLPGQPLYTVKVNVAEPVESAIISVTSGKAGEAEWQNTLAVRRLQEASELADKNELASSTQVYLAQQVAIHIDASQEDSAELAESGATTTALAVQTNLTARLSGHAQTLAFLFQKIQHDRVALGFEASTSELAIGSSTPSAVVGEDSADITASTSTPMLAINTDAEAQAHLEEAHVLRQELHAMNIPAEATTSTTTATSTEKTASTTVSTTTSTTQPAFERPFRKLLELLQK